ncbi:MAG: hypothetical protein AB7F88_01900 [Pyrinomonadaceae bacterium]
MGDRLTGLILFVIAIGVGCVISAQGQSTTQQFPTPITSNEISGVVQARDLGDSRLTTYYYALNGEQGDLFINLVTRNFTGDIDLFKADGLQPMTKIVVYADYADSETGRAIYLRKPEKLLLRVQGRTPNDNEATFRLKFAGSFVAMRAEDVPAGPEAPRVAARGDEPVRVNSVGTIIPAPPKPVEAPETVADTPKVEAESVANAEPETSKPSDDARVPERTEPRPVVVVSDPIKPDVKPKAIAARRKASRKRPPARKAAVDAKTEKPAPAATAETAKSETRSTDDDSPSFRTLTDRPRKAARSKKVVEPKPDPLESINLVVQFKDGTTLEKKMSEVSRFSVDKGVLVVVLKGGGTSRFPITDVEKVTIQ